MLTRSVYVFNAIFRVRFAYTRDITSQAYARSDAKNLRANGGLPPGRWPCMIGLRVREIDEKREGGVIFIDIWQISYIKKTKWAIIGRKLELFLEN